MPLAFSAQHLWQSVLSSGSVRAAVQAATRVFRQRAVSEAEASAEYLATVAFSRVDTRGAARLADRHASKAELDQYVSLCDERERNRTPIQYLVGNWDFHYVTLNVRSPVLIPRPETEQLVQHVLESLSKTRNPQILDVGCGTGAILLAVLNARPDSKGIGIDISKDAISLSVENARCTGVGSRAQWLHSDIGNFSTPPDHAPFDLLVSNPPYIDDKDMTDLPLEISEHEDRRALYGGHDGLDIIRTILNRAPYLVRVGGAVWMEVDQKHPQLLANMAFEKLRFNNFYEDIYGNERFCKWTVEAK